MKKWEAVDFSTPSIFIAAAQPLFGDSSDSAFISFA